jgi:hypothetical protein
METQAQGPVFDIERLMENDAAEAVTCPEVAPEARPRKLYAAAGLAATNLLRAADLLVAHPPRVKKYNDGSWGIQFSVPGIRSEEVAEELRAELTDHVESWVKTLAHKAVEKLSAVALGGV